MAGYNPILWAQQQAAAGAATAAASQGAVVAAPPTSVPPATSKLPPAVHAAADPVQLAYQPFKTPNPQPQVVAASPQPPSAPVTPTVAAYVPPHMRKQAPPDAPGLAKTTIAAAPAAEPFSATQQPVQQQQQLPLPSQLSAKPVQSTQQQQQHEEEPEEEDDEFLLGMLLGTADVKQDYSQKVDQQQQQQAIADMNAMHTMKQLPQQAAASKTNGHVLQPQQLQPQSLVGAAAPDGPAAPVTPAPVPLAAGRLANGLSSTPLAGGNGMVHAMNGQLNKSAVIGSSSGSNGSGSGAVPCINTDSKTVGEGAAAGVGSRSASSTGGGGQDGSEAVGRAPVQQLLFGSVDSSVVVTQKDGAEGQEQQGQQQQQGQEQQQQQQQEQQQPQKVAWNKVLAWEWMVGYAPKVAKAVTAELYDLLGQIEQEHGTDTAACTLYFALARHDTCGLRPLSQARDPTALVRASMLCLKGSLGARPKLAAALADVVVQRPDIVEHFDRLMLKRLLEQNTEEVALEVGMQACLVPGFGSPDASRLWCDAVLACGVLAAPAFVVVQRPDAMRHLSRASMLCLKGGLGARPQLAAALADVVVQRPDIVEDFDRLMLKRLLEQNTEEVALQVVDYYLGLEEGWEKQCVSPSKWLMGVIARMSGWYGKPAPEGR